MTWQKAAFLWVEMVVLYGTVPVYLFSNSVSRGGLQVLLFGLSIYVFYQLRKKPDFSWRRVWEGVGWSKELKQQAIIRFLVLVPVLAALTWVLMPGQMLRFPLERPVFWAVVMVIYPILSVVPQEFVFRTFFFERYSSLFVRQGWLIAVNALCFAMMHVMAHNVIAPVLAACAGVIFARSYAQHRSLKWVVAEHAAYGCLVFTLGVGRFFLLHPH